MSQKPSFNRNKSIILILTGSVAILLACVLQINQVTQVRIARKQVATASSIIEQINDINSIAKSRANDQRVFLLTGDKGFLDSYFKQQEIIKLQSARLKEIVQGNEFQESMSARFLDLTRAREVELSKVLDAYNEHGIDAAIARVKQGHTIQVAQEQRNICVDIIQKEQQHKNVLTLDLENKTNNFQLIFGLFALGECILFVGFGSFLFRDLQDLKTAHSALGLAKIRLEDFYSLLSHELRTPFTSIKGSLGLMKGGLAGELSPKSETLVDIALSECERMLRLINELLDLEKIETGKIDLILVTTQPSKVLSRTLTNMTGMAQAANVRLVENLNANAPIICDEDRIVQVLTNLISNAIKFSAPDAAVEISVDTYRDNSIKFSVKDTGPGIPKDQQHKLFQKFKQIPTTTTSIQKGSGLGLAISKSIAEVHGGKLGFESEHGQGSTFWLLLPASSVAAAS